MWICDTLRNSLWSNLREYNTFDRSFRFFLEGIVKVPRNRLSFTVRIGCKKDKISIFCVFLKLFQKLCLSADSDVFRLKIIFYLNCHAAFGKINNVTYRSLYIVVGSKETTDNLCLMWRLDDYESLLVFFCRSLFSCLFCFFLCLFFCFFSHIHKPHKT